VRRPFEREGILQPLLDTEAPATAHLENQPIAAAPSKPISPAQNASSIPNVAPSQTH
jgi:hypothetical protein